MSATNVDLVFVMDASDSMRPCFEGLAQNLDQIIRPLQGFNFKVRLGLVAMSVGRGENGGSLFNFHTLAGGFWTFYEDGANLFTDDGDQFAAKLKSIEMTGDENHLVALDFALDFPFGPIATTRRVVALFSDEKIEDGKLGPEDLAKIPQLIEKITTRKIQLFAALPSSEALEALGSVDRAQIERVSGGDGLATINFSKLMGQMAKSISVNSSQGEEGAYKKALFEQDKWVAGSGTFAGLR